MTQLTNSPLALRNYRNLLLTLLILVWQAGPSWLAGNSVYGQYTVSLPLSGYSHDGVGVLSAAIIVSEDIFNSPDVSVTVNDGVQNWIVLENPLPIANPATQISWLRFKGTSLGIDVTGDGVKDYKIELMVPNGQCVPVPAGAGVCTAPANCSTVAAYSTATRSKCYRVDVTAFTLLSTHTLCVFGPDPLTIAGPALTQGNNGQPSDIAFSVNRLDENYTWDLVEDPAFLTLADGAGKDALVKFLGPLTDLAEQTFHINVKSNVQSCDEATFTFKVSSKGDAVFTGGPIDLVLVVDVSGSMGEKAECACKGQPGCPEPPNRSKLNYLKQEITNLYSLMQGLARPEDKVGLVSFHSTSKIEKTLVPFSDNTILPIISAWDDNGYTTTAIGQGLKSAVSLLTNTAHKRYIILMTNGMQNETPYLEWTDGSKSTVKVSSTVFNSSLGISVIPIAIFTPSGEYRNLLNALGKGTGVSVVKDVCESNESLVQAYTEAAKSLGSPKLVTFKRDVFAGSVGSGTFTVNENLDRMLVNIINVGSQNFSSVKIEKKISNTWTDITALGTISPSLAQSSIRRLFTISFPAVLNGSPLNSSGEYRYTVNSSIPGIPYELTVIIDDHGVKHTVFTGNEYNQAGEPINLGASVFFNGSPVTDATVVVSLNRPIASFSSTFSRSEINGMQVTKVPLTDRRTTTGKAGKAGFGVPYIKHFEIKNAAIDALGVDGDRMNNADRKYFVLRHEKDFGTVFGTTGNTIPLIHQGNGIYKAPFTSTNNVGLYTMHYLITGNVNSVGTITRMDAKDVYVNFGKPVLSASNLYVMWEQPILISVTPKDGSGNLLGPGQGDQLSIYISKGSASAANDYLNGQYVFRLNGLTDNDDPDVIIRVNKDVLFNGKLSGLNWKKGFLTIQGGYNFPQGNLSADYSSGYLGELKVGYRFWKKIGAQVHFGYYSFKGNAGISNMNIFGGGLGGFYKYPITTSQGWGIIAELNGGYYKPNQLDGAFGYNGGLGLNAFINYKLSLVLEGKYYSIYTKPDNINFLGTTIGLKFHF